MWGRVPEGCGGGVVRAGSEGCKSHVGEKQGGEDGEWGREVLAGRGCCRNVEICRDSLFLKQKSVSSLLKLDI